MSILAMGGNPAENHPCGFKWCDRSPAATAVPSSSPSIRASHAPLRSPTYYSPIRAGTDIAFLLGIIRYAIEQKRFHEEYVKLFTNAALSHRREVRLRRGPLQRIRRGIGKYDKTNWAYEADPKSKAYEVDPTMQDPRCVFQLLKKHVERYTPEMVERICGTPEDKFLKVGRDRHIDRIRPRRVGTIMYALGWTQHSIGVQMIRCAAMLQLLLGNVGRPGGGVNALRGHSNIQGATDMGGNVRDPARLHEDASRARRRRCRTT